MALSPQDRTAFVNAYTRVLITAWSSEEFAQRLDADPKATLRENGLDIPADAEVVLVRTIPEGHHEGSLDVQRGLETNVYELHIPETPQVDTAELTEGDLDSIAAGLTVNSCCCPCCCCT